MKRKPRNESTKCQGTSGLAPAFPLPKKAAASIEGVPSGARGQDLPTEFARVLKKVVQKAGPEAVADCAQVYSPLQKRFAAEAKGGSLAGDLVKVRNLLDTITRDNPTFSATVPIVLERPGTQGPELIASGVLVRIIDRTFLLTAAHVTDRQDEGTLLIPGERGFIPANGFASAMRLPPSGRRADDKLDVAYYWLDRGCVDDLHPDCTVLERQDMSLEAEPPVHTDYTFAGYPWRKGRLSKGAVGTEFTTFTGGEANQSEYEALGLSRSLHIAIRFNRKRAYCQRTGRVTMSPLPDGISGGGVYAWSPEALRTSPVRLPLVGVATEFVPDRSLLVATRLHVFVGCIFHNEPDLAAIAGG
jgi:hypothetical protein